MLVLSRRVGEQIVIDGSIYVTVVAIKGNTIRLGVTAPESVCVDRAEIHERRRAPGRPSPELSFSSPSAGDFRMQTVQQGDHVQVHYVKRFSDGRVASSRSRGQAPLELTIGTDHPRLPGLGLGLIGLAPGNHVTLTVPAERAYGLSDPGRIRRLARTRFAANQALPIGKWVRILDRRGRHRLVRIMEVHNRLVVVDTNHPRAGQALELDVELVTIHGPDADSNAQKI